MEAATSSEFSVSINPTRCLNTNDYSLKRIALYYEVGRIMEGKVVGKCEALSEKYACND